MTTELGSTIPHEQQLTEDQSRILLLLKCLHGHSWPRTWFVADHEKHDTEIDPAAQRIGFERAILNHTDNDDNDGVDLPTINLLRMATEARTVLQKALEQGEASVDGTTGISQSCKDVERSIEAMEQYLPYVQKLDQLASRCMAFRSIFSKYLNFEHVQFEWSGLGTIPTHYALTDPSNKDLSSQSNIDGDSFGSDCESQDIISVQSLKNPFREDLIFCLIALAALHCHVAHNSYQKAIAKLSGSSPQQPNCNDSWTTTTSPNDNSSENNTRASSCKRRQSSITASDLYSWMELAMNQFKRAAGILQQTLQLISSQPTPLSFKLRPAVDEVKLLFQVSVCNAYVLRATSSIELQPHNHLVLSLTHRRLIGCQNSLLVATEARNQVTHHPRKYSLFRAEYETMSLWLVLSKTLWLHYTGLSCVGSSNPNRHPVGVAYMSESITHGKRLIMYCSGESQQDQTTSRLMKTVVAHTKVIVEQYPHLAPPPKEEVSNAATRRRRSQVSLLSQEVSRTLGATQGVSVANSEISESVELECAATFVLPSSEIATKAVSARCDQQYAMVQMIQIREELKEAERIRRYKPPFCIQREGKRLLAIQERQHEQVERLKCKSRQGNKIRLQTAPIHGRSHRSSCTRRKPPIVTRAKTAQGVNQH